MANYKIIVRLVAWSDMIFTMFVFLMEVSYGTNYEKQGAYFRLLGIELKEMFINNPDLVDSRRDIVLACIFYTIVEFIVSALLFFGLGGARIWCAVPWMICKSVIIMQQVYGRFNYYVITSLIVFVVILGQVAAVLYAIREILKLRRHSQNMEGRVTSKDKVIAVRRGRNGPEVIQRVEKVSEVVRRDDEASEVVQRVRKASEVVQRVRKASKVVQRVRKAAKVVEGAEDKSRVCKGAVEAFQVVQGVEEASEVAEGMEESSEIPQGMKEASKVAQV